MLNLLTNGLAFDPGDVAIFIPIIVLMIPIIAILTNHQQKMAEMIHKGQGDNEMNAALINEIQALRAEVSSLRETVHQQAIALDDIRPLAVKDVQQRLGDQA